jgi:hypothetical protein
LCKSRNLAIADDVSALLSIMLQSYYRRPCRASLIVEENR